MAAKLNELRLRWREGLAFIVLAAVAAGKIALAGVRKVSGPACQEIAGGSLTFAGRRLRETMRFSTIRPMFRGCSNRWETILGTVANTTHRAPWNKGMIVG